MEQDIDLYRWTQHKQEPRSDLNNKCGSAGHTKIEASRREIHLPYIPKHRNSSPGPQVNQTQNSKLPKIITTRDEK